MDTTAELIAQKEAELKQLYHQRDMQNQAQCGMGAIGKELNPSTIQRIRSMIVESAIQATKLDELKELSNLFEQYPHIARIIDLLEKVR